MNEREYQISGEILRQLDKLLRETPKDAVAALHAVQAQFDESVVAAHLQSYHQIGAQLSSWFTQLRQMAEQTYENKALTLGCVVETANNATPKADCRFPDDFLTRKRFRAMSDGYKTAYHVSAAGALIGFISVRHASQGGERYYPEWSEDLVIASQEFGLALSLTRQGDILVFDHGRMSFTYRFGHWQYWNHAHIVDLLRNSALAPRVNRSQLGSVIKAIYRAALDVAFRRSGGLFILLRSLRSTSEIVREGDAIRSAKRSVLDAAFDGAIGDKITGVLPLPEPDGPQPVLRTREESRLSDASPSGTAARGGVISRDIRQL